MHFFPRKRSREFCFVLTRMNVSIYIYISCYVHTRVYRVREKNWSSERVERILHFSYVSLDLKIRREYLCIQ